VVERLVYTERVGGSNPSPPRSTLFEIRLDPRTTSRIKPCAGLEYLEMNAKHALLRLASFLIAAVTLALLIQACRYCGASLNICSEIENSPITPASTPPPALVFEDLGTIKAMHGSACAHVDNGARLKVEQSIDIPIYANTAAVFLNGWKLNYSGGDHNVAAITTALGKVKLEGQKLTWQAVGALSDDGWDKAIEWCYSYTVIAWNNVNLHAFVDQADADAFCKSGTPSGSDKFFFAPNDKTSTALSSFPSFLSNANFASGRAVAVLPRGFGFIWDCFQDHNLLQVAYNLEHSETFIQNQSYKKADGELTPLPTPPTGRVGAEFVSWNTSAIFKDNPRRRDYKFLEFVSGMGGPDVGVIQPPFSILPRDAWGNCVDTAVKVETQDVVIDNIPYAYAIPMLTGWQLAYGCDDQNVREIGISIDNLHYDRAPNAPTGTLRYTVSSTLHDDSNHGHYSLHKVTILGLRPLSGGLGPAPR
jgi:hypothetical protein